LRQLERGPAADHKDAAAQRQTTSPQCPADHLVDCIVPPDVLAYHEQLALGGEQPGRVQAAGPHEHPLRSAESIGQARQDIRRYPDLIFKKITSAGNEQLLDAGRPADSACAAGQEVALALGLHRKSRPHRDVGDVPHLVVGAVVMTALRAIADPDRGNVSGATDETLAEQEAAARSTSSPGVRIVILTARPPGGAVAGADRQRMRRPISFAE
jgi:hypothetical protein